jgi:hypothetical protein
LERRGVDPDHVPPATEDEEIEKLNTGIAMVTPVQDVLSVINGQEMTRIRKMVEDDYAKQNQPTLD